MNGTKFFESQSSEDVLLSQDIAKKIRELNLRRIILISLLFLGIELLRLLINTEISDTLFTLGLLCHVVFSIVYILITTYVIRNTAVTSSGFQRVIIFTFWSVSTLSSTPLYIYDIKTSNLQMHFIIIGILLITAPVLSVWEDIAIFMVHAVTTLTIIAVYRFDKTVFAFTIFANLLAFLLARLLHSDIVNLLKKLQEEINTDYLTKLPNRRAGFESMKQLWLTCSKLQIPCYIAAIDIDFFKQYNDTYGHFKGDMALTSVARCLEKCFSRASDIVCRTGGEEFMIAFTAANDRTALSELKILQDCIAGQRVLAANSTVSEYLTISIGIASAVPKSDENEITLFMEADQNLYIAKEAGRNLIVLNGNVIEQ